MLSLEAFKFWLLVVKPSWIEAPYMPHAAPVRNDVTFQQDLWNATYHLHFQMHPPVCTHREACPPTGMFTLCHREQNRGNCLLTQIAEWIKWYCAICPHVSLGSRTCTRNNVLLILQGLCNRYSLQLWNVAFSRLINQAGWGGSICGWEAIPYHTIYYRKL